MMASADKDQPRRPSSTPSTSPPPPPQPHSLSSQAGQFHLRWNYHSVNLIECLWDQFKWSRAGTFADVTLSCEDGVHLYAHRVILAASSPYFDQLFRSADEQCTVQNSHPFVILKDIRSDDMKLLLEYVYKGEVTVAHEQINRLMVLAKVLKVRGLTQGLEESVKQDNSGLRCKSDRVSDADDNISEELTVSKKLNEAGIKYEERNDAKDNKTSYSLSESKYSIPTQFSEAIIREKICSRSSTPVSRNSSPCLRCPKAEVAVNSGPDYNRNESEPNTESLSTCSRRQRSPSPPVARSCNSAFARYAPIIHTTVMKHSANIYEDQNRQHSRRQRSPQPHQLLSSPQLPQHPNFVPKLRMDHSQYPLFLNDNSKLHNTKLLPPSPYSDDDNNAVPYSGVSSPVHHRLHVPFGGPPPLPPHSTMSSSSPSPPAKRSRLAHAFLGSGVSNLMSHSPSPYASLASLGFPMPPLLPAGAHLDLFGARHELSGLGSLTVKKDLMAPEEEEDNMAVDKLSNGASNEDCSSPYHPRPIDLINTRRARDAGSSPPLPPQSSSSAPNYALSTASETNRKNTNNNSPGISAASSNFSISDNEHFLPSHVSSNSSSNINSSSPSVGILGAGSNCTGVNNGSGGSNLNYSNAFVNFVPGSGPGGKPEWKRYKQYSKSDLMSAIDDVRKGMTALQASRKYKVPSRTLYDKIKKLGISTTPRRLASAGGHKIRGSAGLHSKTEGNHGALDRHDGVDEMAMMHCLNSSGGGLVSEGDDGRLGGSGDNGDHENGSGPDVLSRTFKQNSSIYDSSSRPRSVDLSSANDSNFPLDLQVSKSASPSNVNSKISPTLPLATDIQQFYPHWFGSVPLEYLNQYRAEIAQTESSLSRHQNPFISDNLLSLLPHLKETRAKELSVSSMSNAATVTDILSPFDDVNKKHSVMTPNSNETDQSKVKDIHSSYPALKEQLSKVERTHLVHDSEDEDMELIVDNNHDYDEKKAVSRNPNCEKDQCNRFEVSKCNTTSSPYDSRALRDNDTAYVSHSSSNNAEPSSSDSPKSASFNTADSGNDSSNNDISAISENELRNSVNTTATASLSVKLSQASPKGTPPVSTSAEAQTIGGTQVRPKVSKSPTAAGDVSSILYEKSVDSDLGLSGDRSGSSTKSNSTSYKVVSDIGLCSQVRPLDLREASVAMSIPQESA